MTGRRRGRIDKSVSVVLLVNVNPKGIFSRVLLTFLQHFLQILASLRLVATCDRKQFYVELDSSTLRRYDLLGRVDSR